MEDERDYSYLEGAPVRVHVYGLLQSLQCEVAHIDFWLGATITTLHKGKTINVLCMVRPDLHKKLEMGHWEREVDSEDQRIYQEAFEHLVKGIECGLLDERWYTQLNFIAMRADGEDVESQNTADEMADNCIFSQ